MSAAGVFAGIRPLQHHVTLSANSGPTAFAAYSVAIAATISSVLAIAPTQFGMNLDASTQHFGEDRVGIVDVGAQGFRRRLFVVRG